MKIKFLGTSGVQGVPVWNCECSVCTSSDVHNQRKRPVLLVEIDGTVVIIDFGQDFRQQLLENSIKKIDYALLTHVHGDHMNGLEQLSAQNNLNLLSSEEVMADFCAEGGYASWLKKRNPTIKLGKVDGLKIGEVEVETIKLSHSKDVEKLSVACTGFLFKSDSFKFAYIVDYSSISEPEKLYGLDLIISDGNNWMATGTGHIGVKGAVEVYKTYKPKKMLLTHLNHRTGHREVENYTRPFGHIYPAYDGLVLNV